MYIPSPIKIKVPDISVDNNMFEKKKKASKILFDYIDGRGSGYEIDDFVHGNLSDREEAEIVEPIMAISKEYSTKKYLIGISNPDCFEALRELASRLRDQGM